MASNRYLQGKAHWLCDVVSALYAWLLFFVYACLMHLFALDSHIRDGWPLLTRREPQRGFAALWAMAV